MVSLVRGMDVGDIQLDEQLDSVDNEESYDVAIETEDDVLKPVHVSTYSGDSFGKSTVLSDDCGNVETRSNGATGFQITLEGILTLDQLRTARAMRLHKGRQVSIVLQPWVETYILDDFSWDKPNDLNEWYSPNYPDGVEAFTFQLTTRNPSKGGN